jgi:hypothetical protein
MIATVVDWGKLLGVVLTALAAGTGVTLLYSLAVLGVVRAGDRPDGARRARLAYAALAVLCAGASAAAIVYGVVVLTRK